MPAHTDTTTEVHYITGSVEFILQAGMLHQVHAGKCLGCDETEAWIKGDHGHSVLGTAESNGRPLAVIA